jgi:uncharacterized protein YbcV (DUF1398 family)
MNNEQIAAIEKCTQAALDGTMIFPEILSMLAAHGVERYHADYSRQELSYYLVDGASHVVSVPAFKSEIGNEFQAAIVAAAVKQSQNGEHSFVDFVRKTTNAGCVGYFVQISGGCVIYFGRHGETHVERFPAFVVV